MQNTAPLSLAASSRPDVPPKAPAQPGSLRPDAEDDFMLLRRKVKASELLSASTLALLRSLSFSGKLTVILQNGEILKSGYEEGYFRRKDDLHF